MRPIDADKLHYKRVWIANIKDGVYDGLKSAVVVFADEVDKNKNARLNDIVPVVHGEWEENGMCSIGETSAEHFQYAKCSKCHLYHTTPYSYYFHKYNYCPNCGAKMDGGDGI